MKRTTNQSFSNAKRVLRAYEIQITTGEVMKNEKQQGPQSLLRNQMATQEC